MPQFKTDICDILISLWLKIKRADITAISFIILCHNLFWTNYIHTAELFLCNSFLASHEISRTVWNVKVPTMFTTACHMSLTWIRYTPLPPINCIEHKFFFRFIHQTPVKIFSPPWTLHHSPINTLHTAMSVVNPLALTDYSHYIAECWESWMITRIIMQ
jgi:hypothetical protein